MARSPTMAVPQLTQDEIRVRRRDANENVSVATTDIDPATEYHPSTSPISVYTGRYLPGCVAALCFDHRVAPVVGCIVTSLILLDNDVTQNIIPYVDVIRTYSNHERSDKQTAM